MFLLGIGGHLKVSHMDPRVSFGNEATNSSVQKSFLPFYIKSSQPTLQGVEMITNSRLYDDLLCKTEGMRLGNEQTALG